MKIKLYSLFSLVLAMMSFSAFADKVVITGTPTALEKNGDMYKLPADFTPAGDYYYVTVDGTDRVCYPTVQSTLGSLKPMAIKVDMNGKPVDWQCYEKSDEFFEVK